MIKIMSFNIRYGIADDGDNHWDKRKSLVISRIHAFQPDLLGIKECRDDSQADFVKASLPDYHFYGLRREGSGDTALEMAPILFRKTAFQIIDQGCFWLSETPQIAGSKSWDSTFARTATWLKLLQHETGRTLTFVNTHFDYQPVAIDESAKLLKNWLNQSDKDMPVILTGDFNADKESTAYRLLTGQGMLFDAYRQARPNGEDEATFHSFGKSDEMTSIDWVLISRHFKVTEAKVDRTHVGELYPSDHYPVAVTVNWKEKM